MAIFKKFSVEPLVTENFLLNTKAMDRLELNRNQLELIQNPIFGLTLAGYYEPKTATEVAKLLNEPANKIHYRTHRLLKLGLLKIVSQKGRSKSYQIIAQNFDIPKSLEAEMGQAMLNSIAGTIDNLKNNLLHSMNTLINNYLNDPNSNQPAGIWLAENTPKADKKTFEPLIEFGEIRLSASEYDDFSAEIVALIERYRHQDDEKSVLINFGFLAFRRYE